MSKDAIGESGIDMLNEMQPGRAASYRTWIQEVFFKGFARLGKARGERRMELLDTLQLGGKRQLLMVLCDGQRYLVGAGGDSVHSIAAMAGSLPGGTHPQTQSGIAMPGAEMGCRP